MLDTYEVERKPHARALIQLAKLIGVSMTQGGRAGDLLRRAIAPHLHRVPGLRNRLLDSETPPLTRSDLVVGRGLRTPLNGRLCPNAPLTDDTRYDDATRGGFVLVTAVPLSPAASTPGRPRDPGARGGTRLGPAPWLADGKATAALVRPDFTVMRAGRDVAALCEEAPSFLVAADAGANPLTNPECVSTMKRNLYDADHKSFRDSVRSFLEREVTPSWKGYRGQAVPPGARPSSTARLLRVVRGVTGRPRHAMRAPGPRPDAPVVRVIIRKVGHDPDRRPGIHVSSGQPTDRSVRVLAFEGGPGCRRPFTE